jgi:large repetitive protein
MKKIVLLIVVLIAMVNTGTFAQDVFDPSDPVRTYDTTNPPAVPPTGEMAKWYRTPHPWVGIGWNTATFKPYIFNNMAFRLRYPNAFNKADQTKKYPLILFLHGGGEIGPVSDNDYHLLLGARLFQDYINLGEFNGYLFFPQIQQIEWGTSSFERANQVIDSLVKYANVDPDRVIVMGLSVGGYGTVLYSSLYPNRTAAAIPSSPSYVTTLAHAIDNYVHIPFWLASGGLDPNPDPATANSFVNSFRAKGGDIRYSFFPFADHDSWTQHWIQPGMSAFWNNAHKANPLVFFNKREFCPDSLTGVKLGISPGYHAYEWQRNNTTIATSTAGSHTILNATDVVSFTGNDITIRSFGTYRVRFKRTATSEWSAWSPNPAAITAKPATVTPAIKVSGINSRVLPSIDGSTTVPLELPSGYQSYEWRRVSDDVIVSTERTFIASVGEYKAKVKEAGGCNSEYSPIFRVANANGTPRPDAAKNLTAYNISQTGIRLDWVDNATPVNNETGFEIYRATEAGGPYKLVAITAADVKMYTDLTLAPQVTYFYKIRAVNETGASALSNEASAKTTNDLIAPTAPANLRSVFSFRNYIDLAWNSSTDNVGVYKYDIYIDGVKRYTTSDTTFRVNNLEPMRTFNFTVKARDVAGNVSPSSRQVTASSVTAGLKYRYYEGVWSNLPNFNTLTPISTGITPNIDIVSARTPGRNDFFGFVWEGYIRLPVAGTYTFETNSDDGSKVYVKSFYDPNATAVVSNDGTHAMQFRSGTVTVDTAGYYPIAITFFDNINAEGIQLYWTGPAGSGISRQLVPNSAFSDAYTVPGTVPTAPTALTATGVSASRINLSWTDNSNNETGFEVTRSNSLTGTYQPIGTVTGNTFTDTSLSASTTYYYSVRAIGTAGESANAQAQGTTQAPPAAPATPGTLSATAVSTTLINLSWADLSTGETGFEIYRSSNTTSNYRLIATLPANSNSYSDQGLFPNTNYFYKVKAIVVGNASAFSNEATARTSNTKPEIREVEDFTMKYGTSLTLPITVNDADNDDLVITTSRLPRFATLVNISNGNVALQLNPQEVNRGNYPIKIYVDDQNGGRDTVSFIMIVNNNAVPTLDDIANVSLSEAGSLTVNMTAHDAETVNAINWSFEGLPSFASFSKDNAGHGSLLLTPGYAAAGVYTVKVRVDDGYGAWATKSFNITVNEKPAGNLWLVNLKDITESPKSPVYFNDLQKISNVLNTNNLRTSEGVTTNVGVNMPAGWNISIYQFGVNSDAGVYPASVIRDAAYFGVDTVEINVTNLNPAGLYNFRFFSSSAFNHPGYTGFKSGNKRDSVAMMNNIRNRATLNALAPNAAGTINIKVYRTAGTPVGFLNAFEFQEVYNDGTLPVRAEDIDVSYVPGAGNRLSWRDIAYNETSYRVFRSQTENGGYTELNPGAANADDTTYIDATAVPGTSYYYYVMASNPLGNSPETDTVNIVTGNDAPVISALSDLYIKTGNATTTNFTVTDDPGETVTVTAENLPVFASLQDLGGNSYRIASNPTADHAGWYYVTVRATDNLGGTSTRKFRMTVSDNAVTRTVLVNLGGPTPAIAAPWNHIQGEGWDGRTTTNLKTDDNVNTTFSFTSVDYITGYDRGFITGNNSGIAPDSVLAGGLSWYANAPRRFKVGGLDPTKTYSIGLISSLNSGDKNTSTFTATDNLTTQTLTFNSRYNNTRELRFNGLVPTAAGEVNFTMSSEAAAAGAIPWVILNGLIIQEYTGLLRPTNLVATSANTLTKRKIEVTWSDRTNTETSFEVQRSTSPDFSSVSTVSIPANTTIHVDSSLSADVKYYYRVRAITGGGNTAFSNASSAITARNIVYVNLTNHTTAPAPWNNTSRQPSMGDVFADLKNEFNVSSGITLTIDSSFAGSEANGYNPANNPGILPSAVNGSNYTLNQNQVAKLRLSGLDATKTYRIGFSGSLNGDGLYNTSYSIGGRTVYLNAAFNSTKVVYISDVAPNMNGEIVIRVSTASLKGFMNALIIESYTGTNGPVTQSPLNRVENRQEVSVFETPESINVAGIGRIYPNPFSENLNIDFVNPTNNSNINVEIYDLAGRVVYSQQFKHLMAGKNTLRLQGVNNNMSPGVYMLRLKINGKLSRSVKLVKASR